MPFLVLVAILGVGVGILSGLLGVGGGMFMIPLFRLGFHMTALQTTATSLFAVVPTSIAGLVSHVRGRTCIPLLGLAAGAAGALTSPVGVLLANASPGIVVMLMAAVLIGWSAATVLHKVVRELRTPASERAAARRDEPDEGQGEVSDAPEKPSRAMLLRGVLIGLVTGVLSGYVGLGGGIMMVPLFTSVLGLPMRKAVGTSLAGVCILAIPGVVQQMMLGNVLVDVGLAISAGTIPGAIIGARFVRKVPDRLLRITFGLMLLGLAVSLVLNELLVA